MSRYEPTPKAKTAAELLLNMFKIMRVSGVTASGMHGSLILITDDADPDAGAAVVKVDDEGNWTAGP